jgi:hypothetical protein
MGVSLTEDRHGTVKIAVSPTAVGAATTSEQLFSVPGLKATDAVLVNKPTHQTGLSVVGVRALVNQIGITFMNATAGSITPTASENYLVHWFRAENITSSVAG